MKNLFIDFGQDEVRTALVDDGRLVEVIVENKETVSVVGHIFSSTVKSILPSQFVFVDIGQEKNAFLCLEDKKELALYHDNKLTIKPGQQLLVQVIKDATGSKGACVTTQISFPSKNLVVFKAKEKEVGISKKIEVLGERNRLKKIANAILPEAYGIIFRTSSQGKQEDELSEELKRTLALSERILAIGKYAKPPSTVHKEGHFLQKTIGELGGEGIDKVIINDPDQKDFIYDICKALFGETLVAGSDFLGVYEGTIPLFTEYFLDSQLQKALYERVWLKCGGFIIIEQTEACVVIDVNTGKFSGSGNQQKTALKVNMEAAVEIARQIRLRNLSGMIIIDFIGLRSPHDKAKLHQLLRKEIKKDRVSVTIVGMTELGLMQLTRKKIREPLANYLLCRCPVCNGSGKIAKK